MKTKNECVYVKTQEEWDYVRLKKEYNLPVLKPYESVCINLDFATWSDTSFYEGRNYTILTFDEFKRRYEPTEIKESNLFGITSDKVVQSVMNDLNERSKVGIGKYNQTLEREDLRLKDWLQHAYEETLDKANYLKRAIIELEKQNNDN